MQTVATKATNHVAERERQGRASATVERILAAGGPEAVEIVGRERTQRITEAPLDRLQKDGRITAREYQAGDWLRALAETAHADPAPSTVNFDAVGSPFGPRIPSMFANQRVADARIELRRLERAMRGIVWTVLHLGIVKEMTLTELGRSIFAQRNDRDARTAATAGIRVALGALADWQGN